MFADLTEPNLQQMETAILRRAAEREFLVLNRRGDADPRTIRPWSLAELGVSKFDWNFLNAWAGQLDEPTLNSHLQFRGRPFSLAFLLTVSETWRRSAKAPEFEDLQTTFPAAWERLNMVRYHVLGTKIEEACRFYGLRHAFDEADEGWHCFMDWAEALAQRGAPDSPIWSTPRKVNESTYLIVDIIEAE
jgi:hypothetical protein